MRLADIILTAAGTIESPVLLWMEAPLDQLFPRKVEAGAAIFAHAEAT